MLASRVGMARLALASLGYVHCHFTGAPFPPHGIARADEPAAVGMRPLAVAEPPVCCAVVVDAWRPATGAPT